MLKFITSVFLIAATLVSGFATFSSTISASATLANPIDCTFAGMYKDRTKPDSPCKACPVDFVCKIVINAKGDRVSPEKPGKDGKIDSEVSPCPAGASTRGFTFHPTLGTLLTKDQDNFLVGTLATDPSMCKKPDFKCPVESPILVQDTNGEVKCFANCPSNQAAIIFEGVQTCGIKCRADEVSDSKKCFKKCTASEVLSSGVGQERKCISICSVSAIQGQIINESGSCVCPAGKSIILDSLNSNTGKCGVPVPCPIEGQIKSGEGVCFCEPPRTLSLDKKSCNLPVEPCARNTYGTAKPNCKPCPDNSKAALGEAITMDDCIFDPCTIVGQTRLAGKCVCPVGKVVNSDGILCVTPEVPCTVVGQAKNYNGTCECPQSKVLNTDGKSCELPPTPCGINTYGTFKPNCKPCPIGSRAAAGTALVAEDCNYDPCTIFGQTRIEGKCVCPTGTVLNNSGFYCEKPSTPCPAKGQIKTADGECFCLAPTVLNSAKTACEIPPAVCPADTFGEAQPNCKPCPKDSKSVAGARIEQDCVYNPCPAIGQVRSEGVCGCKLPSVLLSTGTACEIPAVPCKANFYGVKEPICMPCPANFTSVEGKATTVKDCKANVCDYQGQIRYLDGVCYCPAETGTSIIVTADGSKKCSTCPANTTAKVIGQESNTQNLVKCEPIVIQPVVQQNNDEGFCGGWWLAACAAVGIGAACAFNLFGFCKGGSEEKKDVYTTGPAINQTPTRTTPVNRTNSNIEIKTIQTAGSKCTDTSANYVTQVINEAKSQAQANGTTRKAGKYEGQWHADSNGQYTWIKTEHNGSKATSFSTTTINGQSSANNALECLMVRYSAINGPFGSKNYVDNLVKDGILHGFNPRVKAECLNLSLLLSILESNGYSNSSKIGTYKYAVYKNGARATQLYSTKEEAKNEFRNSNPVRSNTQYSNPSTNTPLFNPNYRVNVDPNYTITTQDDIKINVGNYDFGPTGLLNLFQSIKANAQDEYFPVYDSFQDNSFQSFDLAMGGTDMDDSMHSAMSLVASNPNETNDTSSTPNDSEGEEIIIASEYFDEYEDGSGDEGSYTFTNNSEYDSYGFSNNSDYTTDYTSVSILETVFNDKNGYETFVFGINPDYGIADQYSASCPLTYGYFNPIELFIKPLKVSALIVNGALDKYGNQITNDQTSTANVDCNNPASLFLGDESTFIVFSPFDPNSMNYVFTSSDFEDSGYTLKINNPDQFKNVEGISNDGQSATYKFDDCGLFDFNCFGQPKNTDVYTDYYNGPTTNVTYSDTSYSPSTSYNQANCGLLSFDDCYGYNENTKFIPNENNYEGFNFEPNYTPNINSGIGKFDGGSYQYNNPCEPNYGGYDVCNNKTNTDAIFRDQQNRSIGYDCDSGYIPGITECTGNTPSPRNYNQPAETDDTCQAKNSNAYEQNGKCVIIKLDTINKKNVAFNIDDEYNNVDYNYDDGYNG